MVYRLSWKQTAVHSCTCSCYSISFLGTLDLRLQVGASSDHVPSSWHSLLPTPNRENPASQRYLAVERKIMEVTRTRPFTGSSKVSHSTAVETDSIHHSIMFVLQPVAMLESGYWVLSLTWQLAYGYTAVARLGSGIGLAACLWLYSSCNARIG